MLKELTVELPEELINNLETVATEQGVSVSDVLKQYLRDLMEKRKAEAQAANPDKRSYRLGEFDPATFKLTPEQEERHARVVAEMEAFVDDLEKKYPNPEPSNAVDLVNEGRRR
jgi:metal-responsive CopG/Arc/MetJ family transcriptional regulator